MHRGQGPRRRARPGGRPAGSLRAACAAGQREGRDWSRHLRQRSRRRDRPAALHAGQPRRAPGGGSRTGRPQRRAGPGPQRRGSAQARHGSRHGDTRTLRPGDRAAGRRVRPQRGPQPQRPGLRVHACVRQHRQAPRDPQAAPRLSLPQPRIRARLGAHEGGAERSRAIAHDRADSPGARDAPSGACSTASATCSPGSP